jgi:hypothetical protein
MDRLSPVTLADARDKRYGEIFLIKSTGVEVYNTTGLNDCPAKLWDALDLDAIKREHGAMAVQKNGPHFWMMDWQTLLMGETHTFGGIAARWAARAPLSVVQKSGPGAEPYKVYLPKKTQKMKYLAGKPVYELVDPEGHAYVLQAREEKFPIDSLADLGSRMKRMPPGWRYRRRVLTEDLVLDLTPDMTIHAVGDEFHQYYTRY